MNHTARPDRLVTLLDGCQVSSSSEAWRHECEARHLADKRSAEERRAYIDQVRARRGDTAANALQALATRIRKSRITQAKTAHPY